jgi:hypothetical protein
LSFALAKGVGVKAAGPLPARGAGKGPAVVLSSLLIGSKDKAMKVYVPRTRKEIERKLRVWGIKRIRGVPLRDLSKKQLTRAYYKQYCQIRERKQAQAKVRRLPGF